MANTNSTKVTRKPLTDEQKKANAERRAKAKEEKLAAEAVMQEDFAAIQPAQPTFTAEVVQEMIAQALKQQQEAFEKQLNEMNRPQVIQYSGSDEKVIMRFQAEVADDNVAVFGPSGMFGRITGKRGTITVPKSEFSSRFLDEQTKWMMEKRWLIVLSGLTEDEREIYGVNYRNGEVLDDKAFLKLLDLQDEELKTLFPQLCESCREMVARRFYDAYLKRDDRVVGRLELVRELNRLSKEADGMENAKKGLFADLLNEMTKEEL